MTLRRALFLAVVVPSFSFGCPALAQTAAPGSPPAAPSSPGAPGNEQATTDQRALAEMLFFTARGLMEANRVPQACQKFAESYRLDPAAGTLLNLAVCHEKEGKIASSWGEFHQALAEARRASRPERVELATEAIKRLEPDLPFVTITVPREIRVPGLAIQRNGVPLQEGAWETELPIDPGTNEITVSAPLYRPQRKTLTIDKRQHMTVTIDPLELAPVERPPPPFWTGKRKMGTALLASGVVAAGVGAVFGVLALNQKTTSDSNCPLFDGQRRCNAAGADAMSTATTDAWVADIGIGAGAAAAVIGLILVATGGVKEEPRSMAWDFRVLGGPHGAQGFVTHSF